MFFVLVVVFLGLPLAELYLLLQVTHEIGVLETIGVLIAISVVGGWLVRREGVGVLRRIQRSLGAGELPQREVVDGALIMLAGALLVTPGFLTDVLGIVLLVPPTRALVRAVVQKALARRARLVVGGAGAPFGPFGRGGFGGAGDFGGGAAGDPFGRSGGAGPGRRTPGVIDTTEADDR